MPQIKNPSATDLGDQKKIKHAFDYLYKTYFGASQIEKEEIEKLPELLSNKDVFIDVGASLGMYTCFANKIMKDSLIYAVEADPDRFSELEKNCRSWQDESNNKIVAIYAAAGDSHNDLTFFKTETHISGSVFVIPERADGFVEVKVPQIMLDDLFEPDKKYLVKIDVEGAEYRVLEGARKMITSGQTNVAVGIHSWGDRERSKTPMSVLQLMFSHRMSIAKTSNHMTANYLFTPSDNSGFALFFAYATHSPMLFLRQIYRAVVPKATARNVERFFGAVRRRKILKNYKD